MSRDGVMRMSLKYLRIWLENKADDHGIIKKFGITHLAAEHGLSYNTARKMIDLLRDEGFVLHVGINHESHIVIKRRHASLNDILVSLSDSRVSLNGDPLKDSKTLEKQESLNGFKFKESSSSSNARAKDWMIPPDEMEEEEEYADHFFRTTLHDCYCMRGSQAGENLPEARRLFDRFIDNPAMLDQLDKMLKLWQSRWSTPDGLKWKPQFKTILEHHLNGGKYRHTPT